MNRITAIRTIYDMISGFRTAIGESPYTPFENISKDGPYIELLGGVIDLIRGNMFTRTTPEELHEYWMEWAKKHKSDHSSIIPYEDLSITEKLKDKFIISIVEDILSLDRITDEPEPKQPSFPQKGDKLKFKGIPEFIYPHFTNVIVNAEDKLTLGKEYTVRKCEVYSSWCCVWLEGINDENAPLNDGFHLQFFEWNYGKRKA